MPPPFAISAVEHLAQPAAAAIAKQECWTGALAAEGTELAVLAPPPGCSAASGSGQASLVLRRRRPTWKKRYLQPPRSVLAYRRRYVADWAHACPRCAPVRHSERACPRLAAYSPRYASRLVTHPHRSVSQQPYRGQIAVPPARLRASTRASSSYPVMLTPASPHHPLSLVPIPSSAHSHSPAHPTQIWGQISSV